ncbi:MAG: amidohydrolase family protein [Burkholderiales bacterium]
MTHDLVVRGGTVVDGTGATPFAADVGIARGVVAEIGRIAGRGREEIDARGCFVTPGFVDVHTHYDGQVTWSHSLVSSTFHGVTTAVMGNCGVGFAPCRREDRTLLMRLMEGVEDIPGAVLDCGLPWTWSTFGDYLDALSGRRFDADVLAQIGHAPLRVFAMGERGANREPATARDQATMRALVAEAIRDGAFGFSTSRTILHRSSDGRPTFSYDAAEQELLAIADGLRDAGAGVIQFISDFDDVDPEWALLRRMIARAGRPASLTLLQHEHRPERWRRVLQHIHAAVDDGLAVKGQVAVRPVALILSFALSLCPFSRLPAYEALAGLPDAERLRALSDPAVRARILAQRHDDPAFAQRVANFDNLYALDDPPDYEPPPESSVAAQAARAGRAPAAVAYDLLLAREGEGMLYRPLYNYADRNLDVVHEMITARDTLLGLSDGGAHYGYICDASFPTYLLMHWTRDRPRGGRLPIEEAVRRQTLEPAAAVGLRDRGMLARGYKGDLNVIDMTRLALARPRIVRDLPAGGRRLAQRAEGYVATVVAGEVTYRDGEATGALPGRLVRRGRPTRPAG